MAAVARRGGRRLLLSSSRGQVDTLTGALPAPPLDPCTQRTLTEQCFEPVTAELGVYNMCAGARVWVRKSLPDVWALRRRVAELRRTVGQYRPDEQTKMALQVAERRLALAVQLQQGGWGGGPGALEGEGAALRRAAEMAGMTRREVARARVLFDTMDEGRSGHVSWEQFYKQLGVRAGNCARSDPSDPLLGCAGRACRLSCLPPLTSPPASHFAPRRRCA